MSVGFDIGSKSIKIVELDKQGAGWYMRGAGVIGYNGKLPEHMEDDKEFAALAEVIKKLHKEAKISSKEINIVLPEPQVFSRAIKFPSLTDQEVASAIKWEAEQYIPIPIAEAVVQHEIIERREQSTPPEVLVLLVAAPRILVEKYIRIFQMAALNVVSVETEMLALARVMAPEGQTVLIMDLGARSTDIGIARNGKLVFSRSLPTAGDAFTRAVSQTLGIEYNQAEEYKKSYGLSASQLEGKIKGALDPVVQMITDEVKKLIHFYQTEEKGDYPKSVMLSGGTAGLPDVISMLTKLLNMEVMMGNPFAKVSMDSSVANTISAYAPLYSIAVGTAMRGE